MATNLTIPRVTKCSMNHNRKVHILVKKVTRAKTLPCVTQPSIRILPKSSKIMKNIVFTKSRTIRTLPITAATTRNLSIGQVTRSGITRILIRCLITVISSSVIVTISPFNLIIKIVRPRKARTSLGNQLVTLTAITEAVETSQTSTEDSNSFRERTTSRPRDKNLVHFTAAILNSKDNLSIDSSYLIMTHFSQRPTINNIGKCTRPSRMKRRRASTLTA